MPDLAAIVRSIYDAFGRGDVPAILEHISDDCAWESWADNRAVTAGVPWLQPKRGKAGVAEFFKVVGQFQIHDFKVLSISVGDRTAVGEAVIDATVPTGRRYRDEELHLWKFDSIGKVVLFRHYVDTAKHIWAAGK
jgi:ketosteroid isomerase-like protein